MIEGLLTPPNVRNHNNYGEEADLSEAQNWIRNEVKEFDNVVLMGVPSSEQERYTDFVEEALEDETFQDAEIYAHSAVGEGLEGFDYNKIEYERIPSRIADIEWMKEEVSENEDTAVFSFDYNIRTGSEIDSKMKDHSTFGQFAADFEDFNDFTVQNYLKGFLPGFQSFEEEVKNQEKAFSYEIPDSKSSKVVVFNAPFSNDISDYDEKMRSEALRHGLALLPYGQKMKDIGKKGLNQVLGSFEY